MKLTIQINLERVPETWDIGWIVAALGDSIIHATHAGIPLPSIRPVYDRQGNPVGWYGVRNPEDGK